MTPDTLREAVTHPTLFTGPMVRATLEDRKSMTRRVVRPQPVESCDAEPGDLVFIAGELVKCRESRGRNKRDAGELVGYSYQSPYGQPGDLLWVRETWQIADWYPEDGEFKVRYIADGSTVIAMMPEGEDYDGECYNRYWIESCDDMEKAGYRWPDDDDEAPAVWAGDGPEPKITPTRKRPSIHMPRWASRLTLRITNVRVERVQDISEEDALSEGITIEWSGIDGPIYGPGGRRGFGLDGQSGTALGAFAYLWDSIYAKRGYGWDTNPLVWVIKWDKVWHENVDRVLAGIEEPDTALDIVRE